MVPTPESGASIWKCLLGSVHSIKPGQRPSLALLRGGGLRSRPPCLGTRGQRQGFGDFASIMLCSPGQKLPSLSPHWAWLSAQGAMCVRGQCRGSAPGAPTLDNPLSALFPTSCLLSSILPRAGCQSGPQASLLQPAMTSSGQLPTQGSPTPGLVPYTAL